MGLSVRDLSVHRAGRLVLDGVSLELRAGSAAAVLGPNGAGKTTLLETVAGTLEPSRGTITLDGRPLAGPAHLRARHGVRLVGEGRRVVPELTVRENLELALLGAGVRKLAPEVADLFPNLRERIDTLTGQLSGGEQQMLALAMGLAGEPRLLLLDEPSFGLAPKVVDGLFSALARLRGLGYTILLSEQHISRALELVDEVTVLRGGRVVHQGPASAGGAELERIVEGYLGRTGDAQAFPTRAEVDELVSVHLPVTLKRRLQLVARDQKEEPAALVSRQVESWLRRTAR